MSGDLRELYQLLAGMEVCLLTTLGSDGHFRARPMQLQRHDPDGVLWFATSLDSRKCGDLRANPACGVAFLDGHTYVSISGRAALVQDRALVRELWNAGWRAWFPDGPAQDDLVLLKVVPAHVEYVAPGGGAAAWLLTGLKNALKRSRDEPAPRKELELGTH